jgi:hypothetical protein
MDRLLLFILLVVILITFAIMICVTVDTYVSKEGGNEDSLYSEWLKSRQLLKIASNQEDRNILERALISRANEEDYLPQLRKELKDKKSNMNSDQIHEILSSHPEDGFVGDLECHVDNKYAVLKYGDFTIKIAKDRYNILHNKADDRAILDSAFYYESLLPGGQQWSIPLREYKKYCDTYRKPLVEGFASPFNSQALMLEQSFCSLSELDKPFGSIGNFFSTDFENNLVIVNPPFVEKILYRAAKHIIKQLEQGNIFIFYGPNWSDAKFYKALAAIPGVQMKILRKNTYSYEDVVHNKMIPARFDSVVFTLIC